jgi:hypothetical protein
MGIAQSERREELRATIRIFMRDYLRLLDQFDRTPVDQEAELRRIHLEIVAMEDIIHARLGQLKKKLT